MGGISCARITSEGHLERLYGTVRSGWTAPRWLGGDPSRQRRSATPVVQRMATSSVVESCYRVGSCSEHSPFRWLPVTRCHTGWVPSRHRVVRGDVSGGRRPTLGDVSVARTLQVRDVVRAWIRRLHLSGLMRGLDLCVVDSPSSARRWRRLCVANGHAPRTSTMGRWFGADDDLDSGAPGASGRARARVRRACRRQAIFAEGPRIVRRGHTASEEEAKRLGRAPARLGTSPCGECASSAICRSKWRATQAPGQRGRAQRRGS